MVNGKLAVSFGDGSGAIGAKVWYDDGAGGGIAADGLVNGAEIRVVAAGYDGGPFTSVTAYQDRLALAFRARTGGSHRVNLWLDDGAGGGTASDSL